MGHTCVGCLAFLVLAATAAGLRTQAWDVTYDGEAIAADSQAHYLRAALADGLRRLYRTWVKTGEEEQCDWTFTLDEDRNILRWHMRRCPSKGYLLAGDVNAQQDYCDHCMGWVIPLLRETGIEVLSHEHNHCGQCFGEFTVRVKPHRALSDVRDVRDDPRWRHGYIDRWEHDKKVTAHAVRLFSGPTDAGFYQLATSAALADPAAADSAQGISARAGRHNA